jgi:RNA polymerase sigma-70 factor (ECF subfamily)
MNDLLLHMSDEDVVSLVQKGDTEAFGIIMGRYNEKLSRYGKKFLSYADNIQDIVQDVFVKAYMHINSFNTAMKFSSWIYRIAHNAFVNALRQKQKSLVLDFDFDIFLSHHVHEEVDREKEYEKMKNMIDAGLEQLKTKYKEVIILHYLEELSYKEISDILHVPVGTVGIRVLRGKEQLRKFYEHNNMHYGEQ